MARKVWTDQEIETLKELFPNLYTKDVAEKMNRSYFSVCTQANIMGIKKSESFRTMELGRQAERLKINGAKHRFKKGLIHFNKGKTVSLETYDKLKGSFFKKGSKPHNTKYDGHERISVDGYIEVRIKERKYVLKHRLIYEQHYGPIPKGMIVTFRDRNPQNVAIENLELISRQEGMKRNSIQNYPKEVKSTIRLLSKLKKIINEKQN